MTYQRKLTYELCYLHPFSLLHCELSYVKHDTSFLLTTFFMQNENVAELTPS